MTKVVFVTMTVYSPNMQMQAGKAIKRALELELEEKIEVVMSEGIQFIDKEELLRYLSEK